MYTVRIRQHIMIAHSLPHPDFGPAQRMHGATYIVDAAFFTEQLNEQNIVIDIALAHEVLAETLKPLDYQNLDEQPQFEGKLTTTEFLAKYIHGEVKKALGDRFEGKIRITLGESHVAWASFEG